MENIEEVCVEVQENENGDIVCVEKMDNEGTDDYCVMECEIATSEEHTVLENDDKSNGTPVEFILFESFSDDCDESVTVVEELCIQNNEESDVQSLVSAHHLEFNQISEEQEPKNDVVLKVSGRNKRASETRHSVKRSCKTTREKSASSGVSICDTEVKCLEEHELWRILAKGSSSRTPSTNVDGTSTGTLNVRKKYRDVLPKKSETIKGTQECFSQLPFQCKMCDQSFRQDSSLKIHLKVHAGKYSDSCRLS